MQTHWQNTLNELQGKIDPFTFTQLFSKLKIASLLNNEATILIPANGDIKEFTPYKVLIEVCWKEANHLFKSFLKQKHCLHQTLFQILYMNSFSPLNSKRFFVLKTLFLETKPN